MRRNTLLICEPDRQIFVSNVLEANCSLPADVKRDRTEAAELFLGRTGGDSRSAFVQMRTDDVRINNDFDLIPVARAKRTARTRQRQSDPGRRSNGRKSPHLQGRPTGRRRDSDLASRRPELLALKFVALRVQR